MQLFVSFIKDYTTEMRMIRIFINIHNYDWIENELTIGTNNEGENKKWRKQLIIEWRLYNNLGGMETEETSVMEMRTNTKREIAFNWFVDWRENVTV